MATPAGRTQGIHGAAGFQTEIGLGQIVGVGKISIDLPSIAAGASGVGTATVTGAKTTDVVLITPTADINVELVLQGAKVSAADTIQVRVRNESAGAIDDTARDYAFILIRFD